MELCLGLGFVLLCYYYGKSEYMKVCAQRELAAIALLPEAVRQAKLEEFITRVRRTPEGKSSTKA